MVPLSTILSDLNLNFAGHGVIFRPIDALNVLCAQLTRDLFAIAAKFLFKPPCIRCPRYGVAVGILPSRLVWKN